MRSKKPLWEITPAPGIYCDKVWGEGDGYQIACRYLDKCWRKPTIKSAFRYAQKVANESGYAMAINARYNLKRFRSKKPVKCFIVRPEKNHE
jgi:hypothetical protein